VPTVAALQGHTFTAGAMPAPTLGIIKDRMYATTLTALRDTAANTFGSTRERRITA
jgi:hypothetical protein